jgi:hypothetical protein
MVENPRLRTKTMETRKVRVRLSHFGLRLCYPRWFGAVAAPSAYHRARQRPASSASSIAYLAATSVRPATYKDVEAAVVSVSAAGKADASLEI